MYFMQVFIPADVSRDLFSIASVFLLSGNSFIFLSGKSYSLFYNCIESSSERMM